MSVAQYYIYVFIYKSTYLDLCNSSIVKTFFQYVAGCKTISTILDSLYVIKLVFSRSSCRLLS